MKEKKEEFRPGDLVQIEPLGVGVPVTRGYIGLSSREIGLSSREAVEERADVGLLLERVMVGLTGVGLTGDPRHIPEPAWRLILTTPTRPNRICRVYEYRLKLISRSDP